MNEKVLSKFTILTTVRDMLYTGLSTPQYNSNTLVCLALAEYI